jgi:hypothetical protein
MQKVNYFHALTVKLSEPQRKAIEGLASRQETTLGAATRYVLDAGLKSLDIKA